MPEPAPPPGLADPAALVLDPHVIVAIICLVMALFVALVAWALVNVEPRK